MASKLVQDGVIRNLEVIGEATKTLGDDLRSANPEIPWPQISGMRDVLIHNYLRVNLGRVWEAVVCDLPPLSKVINTLLGKGQDSHA